ncbi:MAG: hypothetical protein KDD37_00905, partial [Bdellovibrionales bacterium]|nr:hypothetical protein [Bdellovibrionales bacterium]
MKTKQILLFLAMFYTLVGCGASNLLDGSSSENTESTTCQGMNDLSCEMFKAVNAYRSESGKSVLVINNRCIQMAQDHAVDMVVRD